MRRNRRLAGYLSILAIPVAMVIYAGTIAPYGQAFAASKGQAKHELSRVIQSLRAVDTAYASGNTAEAETRYKEARAGWNNIAPAISAREGREAQLLFESLGKKLSNHAPASQVKRTVHAMVEELREDIGRELSE
jgi:hypothetical protein